MIFISLEAASVWCNLWNGATEASSLPVDSFISRSEPVASQTLRGCWGWDGAGLSWAFGSACVQGVWDWPAGPAAAHRDSPRILFWKLYPVMNLLSVTSTLKDFVMVSESSACTGLETMSYPRGFWGLAGLWLSLVSSVLVQSTLPRAVSHISSVSPLQQGSAAWGELYSSGVWGENFTRVSCFGVVFPFSNLAWAVF